ncbi:hypothetical protein HYH02_010260 [Chlamydomonas schloesseri]|uniref:EF-hand domain-containing protein n=1 Tax=Chlamydomonas schloesseri TaxID=2026947 RepID=A0A835W920_9CHLO|nr:hypothetical protein HYH02_010260 [Chlamydomonas schloesseri]|eukprot:KAG2440681.1 hypothetical protein HYH02_010260 [Chlamydomonas schloesseri]
MQDPPSESGPNTPRAPPAIVAAAWTATGGDDAPVHAFPSAAGLRTSDGPASSPRRVGSSPSSPRGAAAMPPPPPLGARSRQASMSRPRPVAEADEEEAVGAVVDVAHDHRAAGAVAGSGHSVRIAPGGVAVADISAAGAPAAAAAATRKPSAIMSVAANKVTPAPPQRSAPSATDDVLSEFDANKDRQLDAHELAALVSKMVQEREDKRRLVWGLGALFVVLVVLLGALTGMTWAVVAAFKDTDVKGGVMYVKGSTSEVVQTASSEMTIVDGALINRQALASSGAANGIAGAAAGNNLSNSTSNSTAAAAAAAVLSQPDAVVRTATFVGTPVKFSSRVNIRQLMELKYLYITGMGEVEVALVVQGVARVPDADSVWGTVVHIITAAGTITLDDTVVRFEEGIAPVFVKAGFIVSHSRRSLLGIYDVLGFFNFIADMEVFNLPKDEPKPALPSSNFRMKLKIYEPCVFPFDPSHDRCLAPAADGPLSPDDTNSTAAGARRRMQLQALQQLLGPLVPPSPSGPVLPLLASPDATADTYSGFGGGGDVGSNARNLLLATAPHTHARLLQTSVGGAGSFVSDLAGVEVVNGSRYMTHTETATIWQGFMRTVYEYALFPGYRRVEVTSNSSAVMDVWQEEAFPDDAGLVPKTWFCRQNPLPAGQLDKFKDLKGTSNVNFTFLGYTELYGKSARHFRLSVRQPVNATNPNPGIDIKDPIPLPEVVEVDYFDTRKDFAPLGFELNHPVAGHIMIQVVEFANLTTADVSDSTFAVPSTSATAGACTNDTSIPRLSSPFTVPHFEVPSARTSPIVNPDTLLDDANPSPAAGRRLAEAAAHRAATWDALDHVNGTDVDAWPEWALAVYGHGGSDRLQLRDRLLLESGRMRGRVMQQTAQWCSQNKITKKWEKSGFPCTVEASVIQATHLEVTGTCEGSITAFPNLKLTGFATVNTCTKLVNGCVKLALQLLPYLDKSTILKTVAQKIGLSEMEFFSLCAGYSWEDMEGYVTGVFSPSVVVMRAELVGSVKWSPCCVWVDEVSLEGYVGIMTGSIDLSSSIGKWNIVENPWYWKGSAADAARNRVPAVQNQARVDAYLVGEAEWGNWGEIQYCHERLTTDTSKSKARTIQGFRLRIEKYLGSEADDTSLNGLRIRCANGNDVDVEEGNWGDWQSGGLCSSGKYINAARIKIEANQGSNGDDTAANSIEFRCNDNTVITSGSGNYGSWGSWVSCPTNQYICGLQVKMEDVQGTSADDTAMNGLRFYCCYFA